MKHPREYADEEVIVLGMARSGVAAAIRFHELGAKVTVNDRKERELCPEADELEALGISVVCGGHPSGLIHEGVALLVKNPGIPYQAEPIVRARELGIEVVTEVEVAYWLSDAPIIGITGSNGKTTTTTWVGQMLDKAGMQPIVAGNIGRALCDAAHSATSDHWLVAELSSFQLKGIDKFRPRIACLLNVYETHLDYHGTMSDYTASKAKLFTNQCEEDIAVLNWDDTECRLLSTKVKARVLPFSMKEELSEGVYLRRHAETGRLERDVVYRDQDGTVHLIVRSADIGIPEEYNVENALAATAIAIAAGAPISDIAESLRQFKGVEHRLEFVATRNEITYYNNSKATNPAATIKALDAFQQPVVLIAGGQDRQGTDKEMDYRELEPYLREKVKAVVLLGETRDKLAKVAESAGLTRIQLVDNGNSAAETLDQAVRYAQQLAEPGEIVLLSPACASWDMFESFEQRGRMFKESVHNL
ncbi:UDP-N-acetylmuramoyl-L-alanine--D-glutamate ligase [Paenibacillus sp. J2TS4]|uniref:UDP-N-acetylmuramoyl-L-alanine--D-glutamate ligase n=1 Tax=Paenibacillus sp. J2TS4 TaxID=2807194 RepID=UPI001B090CAE|nr:UDP-N-acetylmuramoyl-L-alanine--D-glutamate ligase [Paenibacillus sp. J2TS4]GIP36390.1 UDP-N-acetylmuramoylalanine--D-glutamate ligase [Paenibacillus sp. J2TS4]